MKEFLPEKPIPQKEDQLDLFKVDSDKEQEQLDLPGIGPLKGDELNWGPINFVTTEKIDPNDRYSEYKDVKIEFKEGQWLIDDNEKPVEFEEMQKILKLTNKGLALALRNKKFKRIYSYLEGEEKHNPQN
jgi:hypothetical protein